MDAAPPASSAPPWSGLLFGLAAYGIWGFAPVYWKQLQGFAALELLAYRVLWSFVLALGLLAATGGFGELGRVLRSRRHLAPVALAAALLSVNWLVFIWAVSVDQVVATSLGYYLNPLLNVVLGLVVLGERLRRVQAIAVAIAALGVGQFVVSVGELPWIALVLAGSFGLYGLLRKTAPVEPIVGFGVETSLLVLPSLAFVVWLHGAGRADLGAAEGLGIHALVAASGLITAAPLICFNAAAKRLTLVSVGILQYLAPSLTLLLAVFVYGEPFEAVHMRTFACVWLALAIFTADGIRAHARLRRDAHAAADVVVPTGRTA